MLPFHIGIAVQIKFSRFKLILSISVMLNIYSCWVGSNWGLLALKLFNSHLFSFVNKLILTDFKHKSLHVDCCGANMSLIGWYKVKILFTSINILLLNFCPHLVYTTHKVYLLVSKYHSFLLTLILIEINTFPFQLHGKCLYL